VREARRTWRARQEVVGKLPDTDYPAAIVATLAAGLPPGSHLAISHLTANLAPSKSPPPLAPTTPPAPSART
jgi:hypothetical protein